MTDVFDKIGESFQKGLDNKMEQIVEKIDLSEATDKHTAFMMHITIRNWTSRLLVFDGIVLDVNDIKELDIYHKENVVAMLNQYWSLKHLYDACSFESSNVMVLQKIVQAQRYGKHHITADLSVEQNWLQYLEDRVKGQKIAICQFITGRYDKYND